MQYATMSTVQYIIKQIVQKMLSIILQINISLKLCQKNQVTF